MSQRLATPSQTGEVLCARRKALKLSQRVLAERLGISQNRLSELETDPSRLTLDRLLFLVNALGLELLLQDKDRSGVARQSEW
jgi:HTH-type transcriptional regulator/antitoxin HipB